MKPTMGDLKKAMEARAVEFLRALEELMKAVKKILERLHVYAIISFGSRAGGDHEPQSGCDVLIIAGFEKKHLDRIAKMLEASDEIKIKAEPRSVHARRSR